MKQSRTLFVTFGAAVLIAAVNLACAAEPAVESKAKSATATAAPNEPLPTNTLPSLQDEEGPKDVVNYTRVDATVACAGATPPEVMAELKTRGFVAIINFRTDGERGATVEAGKTAAEEVGLNYIHLPFREPSAEVTESFLNAVADPANHPIYIHCGSANRVGAMWLIKRVKLDGWSLEEATAEAEAIGLRSKGLKKFALKYVGAGN